MSKFVFKIIDMLVSDWSDEHGAGDSLFSKGSLQGSFKIPLGDGQPLSMDAIVAALNDSFIICSSNPLKVDDLYIDGDYFSFAIIENESGSHDPEGSYLVDYSGIVEQVQQVDLSTL